MRTLIFGGTPSYRWEKLSDEELLRVPLAELGLKIRGTRIQKLIERLYRELDRKEIEVHPKVWISTEWFCPDGFAGFAIPFYLFHERLEKLHRKHLGLSEGRTQEEFLKILRHETGHLVDNAFGFRKNSLRRQTFGLSSTPYPKTYEVKPYSKSFVRHLKGHYAQAHPDEDWAETFAVWLDPNSQWRKVYQGWPALKKLEVLDILMKTKRGRKPLPLEKSHVSDITDIKWTLGGYLRRQKSVMGERSWGFFEKDLREIFEKPKSSSGHTPALLFLRTLRENLSRTVSYKTGLERYKVQRALADLLRSCQRHQLVLKYSKKETESAVTRLLTERTSRFVQRGHHRFPM